MGLIDTLGVAEHFDTKRFMRDAVDYAQRHPDVRGASARGTLSRATGIARTTISELYLNKCTPTLRHVLIIAHWADLSIDRYVRREPVVAVPETHVNILAGWATGPHYPDLTQPTPPFPHEELDEIRRRSGG